jgi:hypothetical protein
MKASMVDYYENELSMLDLTSSQMAGTKTYSAYIKQFVAILQKIADEKKNNLFTFEEIKALFDVCFHLIFEY